MGEIHSELFVVALSLLWFAGATPDQISTFTIGQVSMERAATILTETAPVKCPNS